MSKITDASFIAHQYTSVSRNVPKKANRYTLFENRLRSCPILPSVPHSDRYRDRSIGRSNARAHRRGGRRHGDRLQHARNAEKPAGERGISGTPDYTALASSGLSLFRNIDRTRRLPQRASKPIRPGVVSRHALQSAQTGHAPRPSVEGAENAYSRPQALRRASARSVASQVNSGSSRPKWP